MLPSQIAPNPAHFARDGGEQETKVFLLEDMREQGYVDLRTGCGIGLVPWYSLFLLGQFRHLGKRVAKAIFRPSASYKSAGEARVFRARLRRRV